MAINKRTKTAKPKGKTHVSKGFDNPFEALGLDDPEERLAKAMLARIIRRHIRDAHWTGVRAAEVLGVAPSDVSDLMRGKITRFSQVRLERFLNALDMHIVIRVGPRPPWEDQAGVAVEVVRAF